MIHIHKQGFTLIEILVAIMIVGILAAIAVPSYNSQITKTRRSDCMGVMVSFAQAMEKYNAINYTYLGAAESGANTGTPARTVFPNKCPTDGDAFYTLTISAATVSDYTLTATPVAGRSQAGDGIITINSLGQRAWDENGDGSIGFKDRDWKKN